MSITSIQPYLKYAVDIIIGLFVILAIFLSCLLLLNAIWWAINKITKNSKHLKTLIQLYYDKLDYKKMKEELKEREEQLQLQSNTLTFEQVAVEHFNWTSETFPKGTAMGALIHAKREIDEVMAEIDDTQPMYQSVRNRAITEYADVFCCVLDSARRAGISLDDITKAMNAKLQINKTRQWKDNGDGSYSHIKL